MARLAGKGGAVYVGQQVVEDCEDVWDESVDVDVTASLDTSLQKVGNGCLKLVQAGALADGDILATEAVTSMDLSSYSMLFGWFRSTVAITTLDDYRVLLDNHSSCVSPEVQLKVPTLAANTWKFCQLVVATGAWASATAVISAGIKLQANDPGAATLYVDHLEAAAKIAGIKSWSLDYIMGTLETTSFADNAHKTFIPSVDEWSGSFEGFKDGAPLKVGSVVSLQLDESGTVTQQWRGSAIITALHPSASVEGIVVYSYDFQGTHELMLASA